MKSVLAYIILAIATTCGARAQQGQLEPRMKLTSPKPEEVEWRTSKKNTITILVLATDTAWFCYPDSSTSKGNIYDTREMDRMLKTFSERKDTTFFEIKFDERSSYKSAVDILDRMNQYEIKYFTVAKMNDEEKSILANDGYQEVMIPLTVEPPTSTSKFVYPAEYAFYIQLKKDGSIWYKTDVGYNKDNYTKLDTTQKEILATRIGEYKKNRVSLNKKDYYMILGDNITNFSSFEFVINALRKNEVHTYKIITEENQ
jgi:biopolymer transport protein ExbD